MFDPPLEQPTHPGGAALAIVASGDMTGALVTDGTVKCWGYNNNGQLGYDGTDSRGDAPGEMAALGTVNLGSGKTATAISAGDKHTLSLIHI